MSNSVPSYVPISGFQNLRTETVSLKIVKLDALSSSSDVQYLDGKFVNYLVRPHN